MCGKEGVQGRANERGVGPSQEREGRRDDQGVWPTTSQGEMSSWISSDVGLIEAIEVPLENTFSHGRWGPAGFRTINANSSRASRLCLEGRTLHCGARGRVGRWAGWGPAVCTGIKLGLHKGRAAEGKPSQEVCSALHVGLWYGRRRGLGEPIRECSTRAAGVKCSWDLPFGRLFFQYGRGAEGALEGEGRRRWSFGRWGIGQEVGQDGGGRRRRNGDALRAD